MKVWLAFAACLSVPLSAQGQWSMPSKASSEETRLTNYISTVLNELGRVARPVLNASDVVTVKLRLTVIRINSVGPDSVEIDCWLRMSWQDPRLRWGEGPLEFGGLSSVAVPADMWLPDIRPYLVHGYKPDNEGQIRAVVFKNGTILRVQPARLKFLCTSTKTTMQCSLKLGNWVYSAYQVDIRPDDTFIGWAFKEEYWKLVKTVAIREENKYPCCAEPYVSVAYQLMFESNS